MMRDIGEMIFAKMIGVLLGVRLILLLTSPAEAQLSPVVPITCEKIKVGTASWDPGVETVRQIAIAFLFGQHPDWHQPFAVVTAPDGQTVALATLEEYTGRGGADIYTVDFRPDWLVLPGGELTVSAGLGCEFPEVPHNGYAAVDIRE